MNYRTRVMVALADFPHGSDYIRKGDEFVATQVDADYLAQHKRAQYAPARAVAPVAAHTPRPSAPASAPAPVPVPVPASPPAPEAVLTPSAPITRRRGRPPGGAADAQEVDQQKSSDGPADAAE